MQDLKADLISLKSVISKMKKTYLSQNEQSKILLDHISKSPYKIILTVDLNNTEYSFVYKQIGSILKDAFDLKGIGFGSTYDFRFMPIRIDYIFISKSLSVKKFKIFNQKISDHMPISVFIDI
jgi:endonuclease/exonuclease/phosphatase family metal-dependent hydrolase